MENYFDDLTEGFQSKAKNTAQDQIRIPRACFSCDGRSWGAHGCLEMDCPIHDFSMFATQHEQRRSTLRFLNSLNER